MAGGGQEVAIGAAKARLRQRIIAGVLHKHGLTEEELLGHSRGNDLVIARKEAAQKLFDAGFTPKRIATILNRDHSTVSFYFSPNQKAKLARMRAARTIAELPHDVRAVLTEYADANETTPRQVMIEWVTERARYEADARARSAA